MEAHLNETTGVPARLAALKLLDAVLRQGLPLESALERAGSGLAPRDRGLAHAIAAAVIRWLPDLDELIDSATRNRLADDAKARMALRIAIAQALVLKTPGHAAISTVLPLVDGGPRKLVHGVFGTLMRKNVALPDRPTLPYATIYRWQKHWGDLMLAAAEHAIADQPPMDIALKGDGPMPEGVSLAPNHLRLGDHGPVTEMPGFAEGNWWVQDLAAQIPARLLGANGGHVLDLCAAPGGKTLQLASAGWTVTAVDASESRLARLRENLERTGLEAEVVTADLLDWTPSAPADAVLLDAPCSATGIFRRHPDVIHRVRPKLIAEMAEMQTKLLARAAQWVKPGGKLVYATCSLEPEEGENQLAAFLMAHGGFRLDPVGAGELPAGVTPSPDGAVRTLPTMLADQGRLDGFFVARLVRV